VKPAYLIEAEKLRANPEQWAALQSEGSVVILAGPGSGKTQTIAVKFAKLLHESVKSPRGIAGLTYNNESARELKRRLSTLGIEESKRTFIGTIHGFCLQHLLLPFSELAGMPLPTPVEVANDTKTSDIVERAMQELGWNENPRNVRPRMARYRRTYVDRTLPSWRETDAETAELVEVYEDLLLKEGLIDFDEMVLRGFRLLKENDWIRRIILAKFPIFIIDEYQDLGTPLHEMVLLLMESGVRIIAVGDPDQSIYDFTGAKPELLTELSEKQGVETIRLRLNYRNGRRIVSTSLTVLNEERQFEPVRADEGTITILHVPEGFEKQASLVCEEIIPALTSGINPRSAGEIAILYNDYHDAAVVTRTVRQAGFKYIGGDKQIRYENTPLTRWVEDCARWCSGGWYQAQPRISWILDFWLAFNRESVRLVQIQEIRHDLIQLLWANRDPDMPLKDWLDKLNEFGVPELATKIRTRPNEAGSYKQLYEAACDPERLGEMNIAAFGGLRGASDHLNLLTLHSAKGLEYDSVIIMGLEQGKLPSFNAETDYAKREQRRRFYVGLTRARYEVFLLYSGWYNNAYGRRFANGPSEYIEEVRRSLM
jgi:DNA helicase-2/ATP-dependent DNA helicase PcrA